MSFTDLLIELDPDDCLTDDELDAAFERYYFERKLFEVEPGSLDDLSFEFFSELFASKSDKERLFCMCSDSKNNVKNFKFVSFDDFCSKVAGYRTLHTNTYFSPVRYGSVKKHIYRRDAYTSSTQCLFLDLDFDGCDFSGFTQSDIVDFLTETYCCKVLPSWCVCSGHGLHLYYILGEVLNLRDDLEVFRRYTDSLIYFYHADVACRNRSRILRVPYSYNAKHLDDLRQTKLFHLVPGSYSLHDLDCFLCPPDTFETYRLECEAVKTAKRLATRKKNGTLKTKKDKTSSDSPKKVVPVEPVEAPSSVSVEKVSSQSEFYEVYVKTSYFKLTKRSRFYRLLSDLETYAILHRGIPVGKRSLYCHIYASISKRAGRKIEDTLKFILQLFLSYQAEAKKVVESVYNSSTVYMYRNSRIAELLGYTDVELHYMLCSYTKEQVSKAKSKRNAVYYESQCAVSSSRAKKLERYEYVKFHMLEKEKDLALCLGCSVPTVQRIKAKIRKEA